MQLPPSVFLKVRQTMTTLLDSVDVIAASMSSTLVVGDRPTVVPLDNIAMTVDKVSDLSNTSMVCHIGSITFPQMNVSGGCFSRKVRVTQLFNKSCSWMLLFSFLVLFKCTLPSMESLEDVCEKKVFYIVRVFISDNFRETNKIGGRN